MSNINSTERFGLTTIATAPDPAPGAEIMTTVPVGEMWKLKNFSFSLDADNIGSSRVVVLVMVDDLFNTASFYLNSLVQKKAEQAFYSYFEGAVDIVSQAPTALTQIGVTAPISSIDMLPGWSLITVTENIEATDQFSDVVCMFDKYQI